MDGLSTSNCLYHFRREKDWLGKSVFKQWTQEPTWNSLWYTMAGRKKTILPVKKIMSIFSCTGDSQATEGQRWMSGVPQCPRAHSTDWLPGQCCDCGKHSAHVGSRSAHFNYRCLNSRKSWLSFKTTKSYRQISTTRLCKETTGFLLRWYLQHSNCPSSLVKI